MKKLGYVGSSSKLSNSVGADRRHMSLSAPTPDPRVALFEPGGPDVAV